MYGGMIQYSQRSLFFYRLLLQDERMQDYGKKADRIPEPYELVHLQLRPPTPTTQPPPSSIRVSLASTHQMINIQRTHQPRMALTQISNTDERHGSRQLRFQDLDEVLDALLAVVDGVQKRTPHSDRRGPETHALEDVGAAAYAAVDEDFECREDGWAVELAFEEG
jgi:hypothetical protein